MRDLVILVHAPAEVMPQYAAALGPNVDLVRVFVPGPSSSYVEYAAKKFSSGKILPRVLAENGLIDQQYRRVLLATFSAGYAFARRVLETDGDDIDGYVAIDSIHYSVPNQLLPFTNWAKMAKDKTKAFWLGHTDVPTVGFFSTTQTALTIANAVGGTGGWFVRRAYDLEQDARLEHIAALNVWGPAFVRECLDAMNGLVGWQDQHLSMAERTILWSMNEMSLGVKEVPQGSNTGPRIKDYLSPCMRDGNRLGLSAGDWCAAFASAAQHACLVPGSVLRHDYRASGIEIEQDAKDQGQWYTLDKIACPKEGDLAILKRGTESWQRHVCRVVDFDASGNMVTIGGNEGGTIRLTKRHIKDPAVLGFVNYGGLTTAKNLDFELAVRSALRNA